MTPLFFPKADETAQQLSYWAVYAAGFVARPVGAILFGHLGDARGRRQSLLLSILTMAVPSILIGALPTHAQAGDVAPVLLALLRVVQGLALGGEVCCQLALCVCVGQAGTTTLRQTE
jgi:MFS family permease